MKEFFSRLKNKQPHLYEFHIVNLLCGLFVVSLVPYFFNDFEITFITYPFRILSCLLAISIILKNKRINQSRIIGIILLFFLLYFLRMVYDLLILKIVYEKGYLYFATFICTCVIPFISLLYIDFRKLNFNIILLWTFTGLSVFCLVNVLFNDYSYSTNRSSGITQLWPIIFGQAGVSTSILSIFMFDKVKRERSKIFISLSFFFGLIILFLSASKGPFLTLIVLLILYTLLNSIPKLAKHWSFVLFSSIGIVLLFISKNIGLFTRIEQSIGLKDESTNKRLSILSQSWEAMKDGWLFGRTFFVQIEETAFYPHNLWIEAFVTMGVVGGLLFICINFYALKEAFSLVKCKKLHWILFLFFQFFIQTFFSASIYFSSFYWILLGIILILAKQSKSKY